MFTYQRAYHYNTKLININTCVNKEQFLVIKNSTLPKSGGFTLNKVEFFCSYQLQFWNSIFSSVAAAELLNEKGHQQAGTHSSLNATSKSTHELNLRVNVASCVVWQLSFNNNNTIESESNKNFCGLFTRNFSFHYTCISNTVFT